MSTSRRSPKAGEPLGREAWAAICAVEGLALSEEGRRRVEADKPLADRRADVLRAYRPA